MRRRLRRRTLGVVVLGAAALAVFGPGLAELVRLSVARRRLEQRLSRLGAEHERLVREQTRLTDDAAYVEDRIRSTFKWARKGEYVIPLEPASSNPSDLQSGRR
jgi:cell division protein FtsB